MNNKNYIKNKLQETILQIENDYKMEAWEIERYFEEIYKQIDINF